MRSVPVNGVRTVWACSCNWTLNGQRKPGSNPSRQVGGAGCSAFWVYWAIDVSLPLEKLGDSDIYAIIESALLDEDWRVRAVAAKNAEVCSDRIIEALEPVLKDKNYFVRINAAQALSRLGGKGKAVLIRLTASDDNFARDMAYYILSR